MFVCAPAISISKCGIMEKLVASEVVKAIQCLILPLELKINSVFDCLRAIEMKVDVLYSANQVRNPTNEGIPTLTNRTAVNVCKTTSPAADAGRSKSPTPKPARAETKAPERVMTRKQRAIANATGANRTPPTSAPAMAQPAATKARDLRNTTVSDKLNIPSASVAPGMLYDVPVPSESLDENGAEWIKVDYKRQRRPVIRGSGDIDSDLTAVEKQKHIHLWSLKSDTTPEMVKAYMAKKNPNSTSYAVEKLKLKHENYASFVVTVPESLFQFFIKSENWPPNTELNEWFRGRSARSSYKTTQKESVGETQSKQ